MAIFKIKDIIGEANDAMTIVFEKPIDYNFKAGQYATFEVFVNGKKYKRSYSFSSSPLDTKNIAITVRSIFEGIVSNYLVIETKNGDEFEVSNPKGKFFLDVNRDSTTEYVFFAAGIGITPIISIIEIILEEQPNSKVKLIYANKSENTIIFKDRINHLQNRYSKHFSAFFIFSKPPINLVGNISKLDFATLSNFIDRFSNQEYFICVPNGLQQLIQKVLKSKAIPIEKIHSEVFVAEKQLENTNFKENLKDCLIDIEHDGYVYELFVPKGKTILEAAIENNLKFMKYDCQDGHCTSCKAKLIKGKLFGNIDDNLTKKDKEENYKLMCQAYPENDEIYLKI